MYILLQKTKNHAKKSARPSFCVRKEYTDYLQILFYHPDSTVGQGISPYREHSLFADFNCRYGISPNLKVINGKYYLYKPQCVQFAFGKLIIYYTEERKFRSSVLVLLMKTYLLIMQGFRQQRPSQRFYHPHG